jgi:hypothetical protein
MAGEAPKTAAEWLGEVRALEGRGELILAYDTAMRALAEFPDDLWLRHRAVLLLAKSGATRRAKHEFAALKLAGREETDIAALEARIAKDEALQAAPEARQPLFSHAADLYERPYRAGGGYYPGVNVATLRLLAGERDRAERVAREVLPLCDGASDDPYYIAVSRAEALLVLGDDAGARRALGEAAGLGTDLAARATTRRQLRLVCEARGLDEAVLAPLEPPTVIHYTGHMIAAPGAAGRFTADREGEVAAAIAAILARQRVGFGYGALASGSDILVAEALLALGAELHVVLPFERREFIKESVAPAGARWVERFEACWTRAASVTFATDDEYLRHDRVFTYGSYVAMGLAVLRARFIDAKVRQLAVWDGSPAAGLAGTGIDVELWRSQGRETDIVPVGGKPAGKPAAPPAKNDGRELRTMLFGDVKGFSKLREAEIPRFVDHVLGALGRVLARYEDRLLYANTWGDGLFLVFDDPIAAAECALDVQDAMYAIDLTVANLPETLALRLGGHFGPVFEAEDPVQHVRNFFGAHVSRTARIEPVTPPSEVYVTEAFAARLAIKPGAFLCDYVGIVPAAKGYGTMRMYHLHRGSR